MAERCPECGRNRDPEYQLGMLVRHLEQAQAETDLQHIFRAFDYVTSDTYGGMGEDMAARVYNAVRDVRERYALRGVWPQRESDNA